MHWDVCTIPYTLLLDSRRTSEAKRPRQTAGMFSQNRSEGEDLGWEVTMRQQGDPGMNKLSNNTEHPR